MSTRKILVRTKEVKNEKHITIVESWSFSLYFRMYLLRPNILTRESKPKSSNFDSLWDKAWFSDETSRASAFALEPTFILLDRRVPNSKYNSFPSQPVECGPKMVSPFEIHQATRDIIQEKIWTANLHRHLHLNPPLFYRTEECQKVSITHFQANRLSVGLKWSHYLKYTKKPGV